MPDMETRSEEKNYRWYILILGALTNMLAYALPSMCLPVLFSEISGDLHLNLVQIGLVWGIGSLPGILTVLVGGAIGDRFGPKRVLALCCLLAGLAGALRGLSNNFASLMTTVFLFGLLTPFIFMNTLKTCGLWFPRGQMGLASGFLSMGMASGFLVGSLISATFLSPWLGGWRNVLFLYGFACMLLCIPWYFTRPDPHPIGFPVEHSGRLTMRQALSRVARIRNVWLLGLAILGISGCLQSTIGYLPLYLRRAGWPAVGADGATAVFHTASLLCVIPMALWSDRLGSRKKVLLGAAFFIILGSCLLALGNSPIVWAAVILSGFTRDGFMAVFMTMVIETDGVGPLYAGSATGLVMVFSGIGNLVGPPLGNSLAGIAPGLPFLFWAALAVLGFIGIILSKESTAGETLAGSEHRFHAF
jgi:MFS family permease